MPHSEPIITRLLHVPYRRLVVFVGVHGADLHARLQELDDRQVCFLALLLASVQEKLYAHAIYTQQ